MAAYTRARPDWVDFADPLRTLIRESDLDQWDQAVYDLKHNARMIEDYDTAVNIASDAGPAINAAIADLPSTGGQITGIASTYLVGTPVVSTAKRGVVMRGSGGVLYNEGTTAYTGTTFVNATGGTMFLFDGGGSNVTHQGPMFVGVNFADASDAQTGTLIEIRGMNNWMFWRCGFRGCLIGVKINSDNSSVGGAVSGGDASWGMFMQCVTRGVLTGVYVPYSGGFTVVGGNYSLATGGIGFDIRGGSQHRFLSPKFDAGAIAISTQGNHTSIVGAEFEAQTTACVKFDGNAFSDDGKYHKLVGCSINPKTAVGAYGIWLASGLRGPAVLSANTFTSGTYERVRDDSTFGAWRDDGHGHFALTKTFAPTTVATTLDLTNDVGLFDMSSATGSGLTAKLPTVVSTTTTSWKGRRFTLKKTDSSSRALSIVGNASETIDGASSYSLTRQYDWVEVCSDGANWLIVNASAPASAADRQATLLTVQGLYSETWPRGAWNGGATAMTGGTAYALLVGCAPGDVVGNIYLGISGGGTGVTMFKAGIYSTSGATQYAVTADQSSQMGTGGLKTLPLTGAWTVPAGVTAVMVIIVATASTTLPSPMRGVAGSTLGAHFGSNAHAFVTAGTSLTDLPAATVSFSSSGANSYWAGIGP